MATGGRALGWKQEEHGALKDQDVFSHVNQQELVVRPGMINVFKRKYKV